MILVRLLFFFIYFSFLATRTADSTIASVDYISVQVYYTTAGVTIGAVISGGAHITNAVLR